MKELKILCCDCNAQFEIKYNETKQFTPDNCPFCSSGNIEIERNEELKINGNFFTFTDKNENELSGYIENKSYRAVVATFEGSTFTKDGVRWKRNGRGNVSKSFCKWVEIAQEELYKHFYNK